jgi:hypothetical protein
MPSIVDDINSPAKILLIGKSGAGKTGALASLVAAGYNLRILDTDKGIRTLRSLLMDGRYPYKAILDRKKIDLNSAVRYIPIDTAMKMRTITKQLPGNKSTTETLLAPNNANAWAKAMNLLDNWKDDDLNLGAVSTWTNQEVLVLDSFSTLAKCAYYFSQMMNGRLGARDMGYDYQRDVGEAQSQLTRLLELLYDSSISCNVIIISHITWVDESQGIASRPRGNENKEGGIILSNPDGYPSAIGRALSPQMGKYFNDVFISRSSGTGESVRRTISTVPQDGVMAKNSVFMDREYPVSYGLAEIFAAIRNTPRPLDLIEACAPRRVQGPQVSPRASQASSVPEKAPA